MKKVGGVPTGKTGGAGSIGKSIPKTGISTSKTSSSTPKSGSTLPPVTKLPTVSTPSRTYASSSYNPGKSKSATFGIIWLPGKKRNKHKELAYNSHKNDRPSDRTPSMYKFMSSESSSHQTFPKKTEEESKLLVPEHSTHVPVAVVGAGAAVASELPPDITNINPEEKQEFIKRDDDSKDGAGDTNDNDKKNDNDYLEHDKDKKSDIKEKDKMGDNIDSVFLRSPPPHKTRSAASTVEEEDCGIKCLYYTLQCCDCVLM